MRLAQQKISCRVLHVVGRMDQGGIENWLMNVLRMSEGQGIAMDFFTTIAGEGTFDAEIRDRSAQIGTCDRSDGLLRFIRTFLKFLRENGPYDAVHSHVGHFSGIVLAVAAVARVPARIAHAHSCRQPQGSILSRIRRTAYVAAMRRLLNSFATTGLAASRTSANWLYGVRWETDGRWRVLHCGIDVSLFDVAVDQEEIREEVGLPRRAKVVGHVGRLMSAKNHELLLSIAAELIAVDHRVHVLLVGDGPMKDALQRCAESMGIADNVLFAGARSDVPALLSGGMDVFLFPSLHEGLGLAVVEAQAAGLPCILSDGVPHEAVVRDDSVLRLPLSASVTEWSRAVSDLLYAPRPDAALSRLAVQDSQFDLSRSIDELISVYRQRARVDSPE